MPSRISALLILLSAALASGAASLWSGFLDIGLATLTVQVEVSTGTDGTATGVFRSPDQTDRRFPASILVATADSLAFTVPEIGAAFEGTIANDSTISGQFRQGMAALPLTLFPGPVLRPQTPVEPLPYRTRTLTFTNPADGVTLCGTLTMAADSTNLPPVVLLVSGSGQQDRDETIAGHKPFAVIADWLARHGVASFRYDDRGTGESGGDPRAVTVESNTADAVAALTMLRLMRSFGSVGVIGHSEGGLIAYRLGHSVFAPDFIISLAGPALPGKQILLQQNRELLSRSDLDQGTIEAFLSLADSIFHTVTVDPAADVDSLIDSYAKHHPDAIPAPLLAQAKSAAAALTPWLLSYLATDPISDLRDLKVPALVLFGEKDTQVQAAANAFALNSLGNNQITTRILPSLNHLMQPCTTGLPSEYPRIPTTIDEKVLSDISDFILSR